MPRLLVLNNYSLERVRDEVARGLKPAHHLYGVDRFPRMGFDVELIPFDESHAPLRGPLGRLVRGLPPIGDVRQQARALKRLAHGDLLYAPCQTQTHGLAYLRALRLLRTPLVILAHHPLQRSRFPWMKPFIRAQLRGTSSFPALGGRVAEEINRLSGSTTLSRAVPWGPDLTYYPKPQRSPGVGAIAVGRTGRDFTLFSRAVAAAAVPGSIFCLRENLTGIALETSPDLTITQVEEESDLTYADLIPFLACARVHAIPLVAGASLSGLTSLTDALALGRPVIITRQPYIDIDIEAEGIGRCVDAGDLQGWIDALRWFDAHPDEAQEMGWRARCLAERRYNIDAFSREMAAIFDSVLSAVS